MSLLSIQDLEVRYGRHIGVTGIGFSIESGQAVGLVGENGAGKTTTLRVILGLLAPTAGRVSLLGGGSRQTYLRDVGFAPEDGRPPDFLNGSEYLEMVASFRGLSSQAARQHSDELLRVFGLEPSKRVSSYSKGMVRRLLLAGALVGNPRFAVLDEPLNGLDPLMTVALRDCLSKYRADGGTLLFSSHILSEVEKVCDSVVMLARGRMLMQASVEQLVSEYGSVEAVYTQKMRSLT